MTMGGARARARGWGGAVEEQGEEDGARARARGWGGAVKDSGIVALHGGILGTCPESPDGSQDSGMGRTVGLGPNKYRTHWSS